MTAEERSLLTRSDLDVIRAGIAKDAALAKALEELREVVDGVRAAMAKANALEGARIELETRKLEEAAMVAPRWQVVTTAVVELGKSPYGVLVLLTILSAVAHGVFGIRLDIPGVSP